MAKEAAHGIAGHYVRDQPENDWHKVTIEEGSGGTLRWSNVAGRSWSLEFLNNGDELRSTKDCPYGEQKLEIQRDGAGKLVSLRFNNEVYRREEKHGWEYGHEEHWPFLGDPKVQSPVEVPKKGGKSPLPGSYSKMNVANVENNGHTFQVNYKDAGGEVDAGQQTYKLVQFHFHSPSEHTQTGYAGWTDEQGKQYPGHYAMEVHFVHTNGTFKGDPQTAARRQDLAVVGVFIREGAHNPELEAIWKESPDQEGKDTSLAFDGINASKLMPANSNYQTYQGSLTTPPLSSGVNWFVMDEPIEASPQQIEKFRSVMKRNTNRSIRGRLSSGAQR